MTAHPSQSEQVLKLRAHGLIHALMFQHDRPVKAVDLATAIGVHGPNRETQRRYVREVVLYAREMLGVKVCASGQGYWLARSLGEWRRYTESVKAGAVFKFVRLAKTRKAVSEKASGQGKLFETARVGF